MSLVILLNVELILFQNILFPLILYILYETSKWLSYKVEFLEKARFGTLPFILWIHYMYTYETRAVHNIRGERNAPRDGVTLILGKRISSFHQTETLLI